jgi:hypothetical protein
MLTFPLYGENFASHGIRESALGDRRLLAVAAAAC